MEALDVLLRYGSECHDHRGALVVVMNRRALGDVRRLGHSSEASAVCTPWLMRVVVWSPQDTGTGVSPAIAA